MIITIKPREDHEKKKTYYKIKCTKCGAEFAFTSDDILGQERRINGTKWVACPECGECIYWTNEHTSADIESISKEEYETFVNMFAPEKEGEDECLQ